jgi:hypothetical protein
VPGTQSFNERKAKEAGEAAIPAVGKAKAAAVFDCEGNIKWIYMI